MPGVGGSTSWVIGINDRGTIIGTAGESSIDGRPVMWR
jgi:hypothetical protein